MNVNCNVLDLVRDLTEKAKKYDSVDASKWLARVSVRLTFRLIVRYFTHIIHLALNRRCSTMYRMERKIAD